MFYFLPICKGMFIASDTSFFHCDASNPIQCRMVGFFCKNAEKEIPILIWIESAGNDDIGSRWKAKTLAYFA